MPIASATRYMSHLCCAEEEAQMGCYCSIEKSPHQMLPAGGKNLILSATSVWKESHIKCYLRAEGPTYLVLHLVPAVGKTYYPVLSAGEKVYIMHVLHVNEKPTSTVTCCISTNVG